MKALIDKPLDELELGHIRLAMAKVKLVSKYLFANKVKELQKERKNKPTNYIEVTVTN